MSRDYITNPLNISGNYLLGRSWLFINLRGQIMTFTGTSWMQYSYGSGILTQIQPVYYTGTTLTTGRAFSGTNFIWSTITRITGNLLWVNSTSNGAITVTGIASSPATMYNLFWDITWFAYGVASNTSTGITLIWGINSKRVVTQLYDPANYFAMHFQSITTVVQNIVSTTRDIGSGKTAQVPWNLEKAFTGSNDYFTVTDYSGSTRYTTLLFSDMTDGNGDSIAATNINIRTNTGVIAFPGTTPNPNVISNIVSGAYTTCGYSPIMFLQRTSSAWWIGTYGVQTWLKVNIPTLQAAWYYHGTITYTLP